MTDTIPGAAAPSPDTVRKALRAVKDPELNLNIIDIGLVYDVEVSERGRCARPDDPDQPGLPGRHRDHR